MSSGRLDDWVSELDSAPRFAAAAPLACPQLPVPLVRCHLAAGSIGGSAIHGDRVPAGTRVAGSLLVVTSGGGGCLGLAHDPRIVVVQRRLLVHTYGHNQVLK